MLLSFIHLDYLTRFALLVTIPNKSSGIVERVLIERVIGVVGPLEKLHSDKEMEFENQTIHHMSSN